MSFFSPGSFPGGFFQPPGESGPPPEPGDEYIGTIYDETGWANLNDFTIDGFTPTLDGSDIVISGGSGDFSRYMMFGPVNNDENLTIVAEFDVVTEGNGFSVGFRRAEYPWGLDLAIQCDTDSNEMNFWWVDASPHRIDDAAVATPEINTGNRIRVTLARSANLVTGTVLNVTTGLSVTATKTCNMAADKNFRIPNTTKPCVWQHGGESQIVSLEVSSASISNPDYLFIGDSKTVGFSVGGELYLRWPSLVTGGGKTYTVMAGDGEETAGIVSDMPYILEHIEPCIAVLCIGSNDLRGGVSSGVWQANLDSIVDDLKTAGFTVVHVLPIPEVSLDQSSLKSYIQSTFTDDDMIDPSTNWVPYEHISGDGVHPSAMGSVRLAKDFINSGFLGDWTPYSDRLGDKYIGLRPYLSFEKMSERYTGPALLVRRSSDNALQSIEYDENGDPVLSAITTFLSSNDGYLAAGYDSTGNGEHFIPPSNSQQPKIATAGTLNLVNGKLVCDFDGVNDKGTIAINITGSQSWFFSAANKRASIADSIDLLFTTKGSGLSDPGLAIETGNKFASTSQRQVVFDIGTNGTTGTTYKNGATSPLTLNQNEWFVGSTHSANAADTSGIVIGAFPGDDWFGQNGVRAIWGSNFLASNAMINEVTEHLGDELGITVATI